MNNIVISAQACAWVFSIFEYSGFRSSGVRGGCSLSGSESTVKPGVTGWRQLPLTPDDRKPFVFQSRRLTCFYRPGAKCFRYRRPGQTLQTSESHVERSIASKRPTEPNTPQAEGLEPSGAPGEGCGENGGGVSEGFHDSKVLLPQDTAARGSTTSPDAHIRSKPAQNDVRAVQTSYYAHYLAQTHKASENVGSPAFAENSSLVIHDVP